VGLVSWIVVGLIAGALARFLVPGRDPLGCLGTILLGMAGSLVGGFLANLVFGGRTDVTPSGLLGSVVGAILILLVLRLVRGPRYR
jgi:uncharacterized membrane protein YeaQ/YmgE (transglycosylase-associated protein family)